MWFLCSRHFNQSVSDRVLCAILKSLSLLRISLFSVEVIQGLFWFVTLTFLLGIEAAAAERSTSVKLVVAWSMSPSSTLSQSVSKSVVQSLSESSRL